MSSPMEPFESQDKHDDDGQVIDSFLIETDAPPDLRQAEMVVPIAPLITVRPITRILSGYRNLHNGFTVEMILPADADRLSLTLAAFSTNATPTAASEYISIADENGKVLTSSAYLLRHGRDPLVLTGHTGPLYAVAGSGVLPATPIELTWMAITR